MADVRVDFKGNAKGVEKAAEKAKAEIKKVSTAAKKSTAQLEADARKQEKIYNIAFGAITGGFAALAVSAKNTFKTFREESERSLAAVRAALGNISVEIGNVPGLQFTNREDLVQFGRDAQAEVNRLNGALDNTGVVTRLQENDTVLKGIVNTSVNIVGLFSDQVRAQQAQTQELLRQRKLAQERVNFAKQQLELIEQQRRVTGGATAAGATTAQDFDTGPGRIGGDLFLTPGNTRRSDPFSFGALPDAGAAFFGDDFDESIAEATLNIRNFETAVKAGLVPSLEAMQGRTDLLRERLLTMIEQGVSPASVGFQQLQEQLRAAEAELQAVEASALSNEVAFTVFADVANQALDSIIFKTESLSGALRNVGRNLLSTFLRAGVNVGVGAITGNPLSFGNALAGAVGIPVGASSAAPTADLSKATLSSSQLNSFGGAKVQVEATATRISGGDLLLTIQEAQNTRGTGGINIS